MEQINTALFIEILSNIATTTGIFIATITFVTQSNRERREREYGTFSDLDDKYVEFMYKCSENPELDLSSDPEKLSTNLPYDYPNIEKYTDEMNEKKRKKERALFSVLISIFERSYVMFHYRCKDIAKLRDLQFGGWEECIKNYCLRPSFLYEWKKIGYQFDLRFQNYMNEIITSSLSNLLKEKPNH